MHEAQLSPVTENLLATPHGFFGREGGVSEGLYTSLNCGLGSGDDGQAVVENRRRAANLVAPGKKLATLYQVHSADAVIADNWADDDRPKADGLVTNRSDLVLGIVTADCAPVLMADSKAGVIGAAHAGWRGAFSGVLEATVQQMATLGAHAADIVAVVGPCIGRRSYEVDESFFRRFLEADEENGHFFQPARRADHYLFDLEGYVIARLAAAGVGKAIATGLDTFADEKRFFSFRRTTHAKGPDYGRQISLISLG